MLAVITESTGVSVGLLVGLASGVMGVIGVLGKVLFEVGRSKQRQEEQGAAIKDMRHDHDNTESRIVTVLERLTDGQHAHETRIQLLERGKRREE